MTWLYSGDPANSTKDFIRFTIGDTIDADPLLTDEEIVAAVTYESTNLGAAARCCEAIATKYARLCDSKLGPQSKAYSQKYMHYSSEARKFRAIVCAANAPTAGGLLRSDELVRAQNTNAKQPVFSRDMMTE
jgi:hypothetical protein